ncbi:MAG: VanZ family protein [Desulfobulbaceae bacterium]|jgi:VanZ family protein|nr:VanZ family protein [Desulfobulbaceae bacterium]
MGFLLILTGALILYGGLYPFRFDFALHQESVLAVLLASARGWISLGDTIANAILFFPFGFFAMQRGLPRVRRFALLIVVVVAGAAFSLGIECAQTGLPSRVPSVYDLAMNTVGTLLGALLGWNDWRQKLSKFRPNNRPPALFPFLLLGAWLAGRLFPFVPTFDVQNVKDALKPLLFAGLSPLDALRYVILTMVVCRLIRAITVPGTVRTAATFLPLAIIAAKPFIEGRSISQAEILGVSVGMTVWWCISGRIRPSAVLLSFLLATQIVIQAMQPFAFSPTPVSLFSFIPFIGFMEGSMLTNILSFIEKIFLYGSLVWLLIKAGGSLRCSLISSVAFLACLECMQMFLPGRVPEITDPLLAVILGLILRVLDLRARPSSFKDAPDFSQKSVIS